MACHFRRDDVALPHFSHMFNRASNAEWEHAVHLMYYLNTRGGRINLMAIQAPEKQEWGSIWEAIQDALALEKHVNESLLHLHRVASGHMDVTLCRHLNQFLQMQVKTIHGFAQYATYFKRLGDGVGVAMRYSMIHKFSDDACSTA